MIIKIKKETNYSIISNEPLHDERLSYGARGVLAYLLTLPSNWNINMSHLVSKSKKDGRDKVTGLFSELMELGYAERTEVREKGRFKGYEYTVYEKPPQTENTESVQKTDTGLSHTVSPKTETAESVNRKLISTNSNKDLKEINTNSNNIESTVFSKNDHTSEIDSLRNEIEELKSLIKQQKNKSEAEGAKCNNVASRELAVLSASIGTSYVSTQESKDKPVKATKMRKNGNITIEQDANFASFEVFAEKWDKVLAAKYPKLDAILVYEWFVPAVQAKYNGTYKDHFAALRTWLGRSSDAELAKLSKFKPTEQYNNEGLINEMLQRTAGQPTTMDKINAKAQEVWEKYMNDQNNK